MIFVDTGPFLARYLAKDQHHRAAVAAWDKLRRSRERCFTSNFVLDEFFTLLGRRAGYAFAAERARNIYASESLEILRPAGNDERRAIELFDKYSDQRVSFTDCISFALIRDRRIRRVFSFDRYFESAGFILWPSGQ